MWMAMPTFLSQRSSRTSKPWRMARALTLSNLWRRLTQRFIPRAFCFGAEKLGQRTKSRPGRGITGKEAAEYIEGVAKVLGAGLKSKSELEQTREILSRGTPLSTIIREMRDSP